MTFDEMVQEHFPGSSRQASFVRRAAVTLIQDYGFAPANTLACVGVCRDELCRPLSDEVEAMWGGPFDLSSLAGILTVGITGLAAARTHAPKVGGRRRFVFFLFSHIGLGARGEQGVAMPPGQAEPRAACGALVTLQEGWRLGRQAERFDWQDPELSLVKARLKRCQGLGKSPTLVDLTKAAHQATVEDLRSLVAAAFDPEAEDFAVVAGVQIHGPAGAALIWPGTTYVRVRGHRSEIWI